MSDWDGNALRVLLQFFREQDSDDPYTFRFGSQAYIVPTQEGASPNARFDWSAEVLADLEAVRKPGRDPSVVQRMGERLRRFLAQAGWVEYERRIVEAVAANRRIYLTIRSSAAELYALPWELLTLQSGQFVGEVPGLLLRFEWPESPSVKEKPLPRPEGGRIVIAYSAAVGSVPAAEHIVAIRAACAAGFRPFDADTDVIPHASLERIAETLSQAQQQRRPIAVLHLLCHGSPTGSTFGIALDGTSGPVVADAMDLRKLAPFAAMVRLVVLSVCDSGNAGTLGNQLGSVAQALHRCGFQAVIASRFPLSVVGSIHLAETLYGELLSQPASLESALLSARRRLAIDEADLPRDERRLDWASLQLYAREGDGDDTRPVVFRPYRGLLAFQPEDRRFYFGRGRELAEILRALQALRESGRARFLIVAGGSGTGKSSLVLAGAVPKLAEVAPPLRFLRMRPGRDPVQALETTLAGHPPEAGALLVVDQMEELFTQTSDPGKRQAFARRLWSLACTGTPDVLIVVTLRVDFIGRCGELLLNDDGLRLDRIAYDDSHRVFIAQLGPEELRAAIEGPAHRVGLSLQAGLTERMLEEVGREPGALPMLEDALDVLWQHREDRFLTQAAYQQLGGVVGALQQRADAIIAGLSKEELAIAKRLFVSLVAVAEETALDTRVRANADELARSFLPAEAAGFARVIGTLVAARLLVQDGDGKEAYIEVAHEALIRRWPRLRAWLDEDRARLLEQRQVRRAAQQWQAGQRDESLLYRGAQLAQVVTKLKDWMPRLGALERAFLEESEACRLRAEKLDAERQQREQEAVRRQLADERRLAQERAQRRRWAILGLTSMLVMALGALGTVLHFFRLEERQRVLAENTALREMGMRASALSRSRDSQREALRVALLSIDGWLRKGKPPALETASGLVDAVGDATLSIRLQAPRGQVNSALFAPDGRTVATTGSDGSVRIWDARTGQQQRELKGHETWVSWAAYSPDGGRLATASRDRTVRIFDSESGATVMTLHGHEDYVLYVGYSADASLIVTASQDRTARIWDARNGQQLQLLAPHPDIVSAAAFSPDRRTVATAGKDGTIRLWNADTGQMQGRLGAGAIRGAPEPHHEGWVRSLEYSTDGGSILTASDDGTARLWNAASGALVRTFSGHDGGVLAAVFSPDGQRIATAGLDGTARIWDTRSGMVVTNLEGHHDFVTAVSFSRDGRRLVTSSTDGSGRIWEIIDGRARHCFLGHAGPVNSATFSPDGLRIVTAGDDRTIRLWDAREGIELRRFGGHGGPVFSARFSPDGQRVVTGGTDKTLRIFSATTGALLRSLPAHAATIYAAIYSPDGTELASASEDGTAALWDAAGGERLRVLGGHGSAVTDIAYSADGSLIVTASRDKSARVWARRSGQLLRTLDQHPAELDSATFSADGTQVITACRDQQARIWDVHSGELAGFLSGHFAAISAVGLSADGRILTASRDKTTRLWDAQTRQAILLLNQPAAVQWSSFSRDGTQVLSALADGSVCMSSSFIERYVKLGCALLRDTAAPGRQERLRICTPP